MISLLRAVVEGWSPWWVWAWWLLILLFLLNEGTAIFQGGPHPTLTKLLTARAPWWVVVPILCWVVVHFSVAYAHQGKL